MTSSSLRLPNDPLIHKAVDLCAQMQDPYNIKPLKELFETVAAPTTSQICAILISDNPKYLGSQSSDIASDFNEEVAALIEQINLITDQTIEDGQTIEDLDPQAIEVLKVASIVILEDYVIMNKDLPLSERHLLVKRLGSFAKLAASDNTPKLDRRLSRCLLAADMTVSREQAISQASNVTQIIPGRKAI